MSSKSSSSTENKQYNTSTTQDNRIVADAGAITFSQADGNTITSTDNSQTVYQSLDAGAIGSAFDFAENISKGAANLSAASLGQMGETTKNALASVKDAYANSFDGLQDMAESSNKSVAGAWQNAVGAIDKSNKTSITAISTAYKDVTDQLADAWQESKAGEQKMLAFGLMALVAFVGLRAVGGR